MKAILGTMTFLIATIAFASEPIPEIKLPDADWRIMVKLEGFELADDQIRSDRLARKLVFIHQDARINLTAVMKPAQSGSDAATYRDTRWERIQSIPPSEESVRLWTEEPRAFLEYFTESFQGQRIHQKHVHTFLVHKGNLIEIHASVTLFREEDQTWLDNLQRSIEIVADGEPKSHNRLNLTVRPIMALASARSTPDRTTGSPNVGRTENG